jgi:peptidoglycan hydrolase CwlO-like protein
MGKALKPLVVILLLLSIAALVLGSMLFSQREILKNRTQTLERSVVSLATYLAAPKDPHIEKADVKLDEQALMDLARMQEPLGQLSKLAEVRYEQLFQTKDDLQKTREELKNTRDELALTKTELKQSQDKVSELQTIIQQKETELTTANNQISQLQADKTQLQAEIDSLKQKLADAEEEVRDLQQLVAQLEAELAKLYAEKGVLDVPRGLSGKVVAVNPDWNFVILDIGSLSKLKAGAEMIVHRGDQLIGKVRVSNVELNMAVAEIEKDWEKAPIKEGDSVFF